MIMTTAAVCFAVETGRLTHGPQHHDAQYKHNKKMLPVLKNLYSQDDSPRNSLHFVSNLPVEVDLGRTRAIQFLPVGD